MGTTRLIEKIEDLELEKRQVKVLLAYLSGMGITHKIAHELRMDAFEVESIRNYFMRKDILEEVNGSYQVNKDTEKWKR